MTNIEDLWIEYLREAICVNNRFSGGYQRMEECDRAYNDAFRKASGRAYKVAYRLSGRKCMDDLFNSL